MDPKSIAADYIRDGYASPIRIIGETEAAKHRHALEAAEARLGPLHYRSKMHTIMRSPLELATHPKVLDLVEELLGPNLMLYNVTYIIKEPHTPAHVSWHQDLTYWGLSDDAQVSMWLALSPATEQSGCMRMLPGSHTTGMIAHETTEDAANVLLQGQTVKDVAEDKSVSCPLEPGEASFHHGWTLHASMPNNSDDRRIGLNVQYLAAHVRQTKHDHDSAMLVRGTDTHGHWPQDHPATTDFDPAAMTRWEELCAIHVETAGTA